MTVAADLPPSASQRTPASVLSNPFLWLAAALIGAGVLLSLPLVLPIGPMYWDVYLYYDAANRIFDGQAPVIDFFTPVGPLGYYLFAGGAWLFPDAHPTLLAHWSLLVLTAPLMGIVLWDVGERSRPLALALLLPFLLYALLPFNTRAFSTFPGSDGFGIYNRQVCQMLYVLVAALMFMRSRRLLSALVAITMTALFFLKITGFVAAGIICAFAFVAGRVPLRFALAALAAFAAALGLLELVGGLVNLYVADIAALVRMNSGTLLPRFLQATSLNFGIVLPAVALIALLLWVDGPDMLAKLRGARSAAGFAALVDSSAFWLAAILFAGILFETQNTGSQALIFLWPVALAILLGARRLAGRPLLFFAIGGLVAAMTLPPALQVVERAARAYVGGLRDEPLENRNLGTLGHVSVRKEVADRSAHMMDFYATHRPLYQELIPLGELPSFSLYQDLDFQALHLKAMDAAVDAIRALEADKGVRFQTIMSINFANPFPWLMDRSATRYLAIGADPFRAVPPPDSDEEKAIADTDLVLEPVCPPTTANAALFRLYSRGLAQHRRIKLTDCYDAFVHPKFAEIAN